MLVLGGGLAGMATAYELGKLGYDCRVLEGRLRPGGRCHTIRRGTASEEEGSKEVAAFDEGLYYNPGPMRIPHTHNATLDYCRELQVPVEVFVNDNEAAFMYQAKTHGARRQAAAQPRGPRRHGRLRRGAPQQGDLDPRARRAAERGRSDRAHRVPAPGRRARRAVRLQGHAATRLRDAARCRRRRGNAVGAAAARRPPRVEDRAVSAGRIPHAVDDAAGRGRHGSTGRGVRGEARRPHHLRRRGDGAPSDRERRVGGLPP